jgi:hypothetical protein
MKKNNVFMVNTLSSLGKALLYQALFLITLLLCYYIYVNYFKVNVLFYDSVKLVVIVATLFFIITGKIFLFQSWYDKILQLVISALLGYALIITFPTIIDRSLSFYFLEKIQQRGGGIQISAFEDIFTKEYAKEHRLVDIRLTEQIQSGMLIIENDCVLLTRKGNWTAKFSLWFRKHLLPKKRLLNNEYTDVLVNPFAKSTQLYDYRCNP